MPRKDKFQLRPWTQREEQGTHSIHKRMWLIEAWIAGTQSPLRNSAVNQQLALQDIDWTHVIHLYLVYDACLLQQLKLRDNKSNKN
jgi:hypothetical protein